MTKHTLSKLECDACGKPLGEYESVYKWDRGLCCSDLVFCSDCGEHLEQRICSEFMLLRAQRRIKELEAEFEDHKRSQLGATNPDDV